MPFGQIDAKASSQIGKDQTKTKAEKIKAPLPKTSKEPIKHEEEARAGGMELTPPAKEADRENVDEMAVPKMESLVKNEKRPNLKKVKTENVASGKDLRPRRAF